MKGTILEPYFKNAIYWSNKEHWKWANQPNLGKSFFLKENISPIQESGQLKFIERNGQFSRSVFPNMDVFC